jgi:hypothetical protein
VLVIFPVVALALVFAILRRGEIEWRCSAISAALVWSWFLVAVTELLSLPQLLTRATVAVAWIAFCAVCLVWLRRSPRMLTTQTSSDLTAGLPGRDRWLICGIAVVVGLVGISAIVSPPNTSDAMRYHMPRIVL